MADTILNLELDLEIKEGKVWFVLLTKLMPIAKIPSLILCSEYNI